ncbi:AIR synthase-related protein [Serratia ureilytica]
MCRLNKPGADFAEVAGVTAMTDITGFGLLGHLSEVCGLRSAGDGLVRSGAEAAGRRGVYRRGCVPGGTGRNFDSYGHLVGEMSDLQRQLLCDPQTSGGLLLAVLPEVEAQVLAIAGQHGITSTPSVSCMWHRPVSR